MNRKTNFKIYINNSQHSIKISMMTRLVIRRCCRCVLKYENINYKSEVSIALMDDSSLKFLNNKYRNKNSTTDVLSFPINDIMYGERNQKLLGDIAISIPQAKKQGEEYGNTLMQEIAFLTVHGMLHLLGYDHQLSKKEEKIMFDKQNKILSYLGIR